MKRCSTVGHHPSCQCHLAPRRTEVEDLREALEDAADSLETIARWSQGNGFTIKLARSFAANRAAAARRALK